MVSFILCLLPALLATMSAQASTLTCKTCAGSADACRTAQGTCRVDKATGGCYSTAEEITLDGEKTMGFSSGCLEDYNIGIKGPITVTVGSDTHLQTNTSLCNTDNNCNSAVPEVPTGSTTENGLQCPTCLDLNSATCTSTIAPCTGDETYCIDFTGKILNGSSPLPFAAKGCTTESTKEIKSGTFLSSGPNIYLFSGATYVPAEKAPTTPSPTNTTLSKTTRSGASPALGKFSFALYLPGLTGLLLVKLLS
nr:phospholipase A2 inhibitor and Ly6/PLAUR domain-containing protein-like isoform X2 [Chelonoidis abingdonii]XP_032659177.1 phospholipase A2 inhibitor and Ly6/PLAUR domain-containing protein-like isoform X2 [Chelonoidis abingdonii]XP_032659178.1 phospholipase A2 inhibitor and Ly6/PLAUR domain-containing protein-like isoform X2 [Chelonoidis abingdonii]